MSNQRPRYVQKFRDRHGRTRYYYRRRGQPLSALPDLDSPHFLAAYALAEADGPGPEVHGSRPTWVYFFRAEVTGLIKIGKSGDVRARRRELQAASPDRLTLLTTVYDASGWALERQLHRRFAADHSHGEWFRPSEELVAFIAELPLPAAPAFRPPAEERG